MSKSRSPAPLVGTLTLLAPFALAGCGGGDEAGASAAEGITVELAEEKSSGQSGTATLTPVGDTKTRVVVTLSNPPDVPQPSHVHPGSCGDLGDPVAALANVVGGKAETVVDMSLAELQRGGLVVHAHKSEEEYDVSVACGEIPKPG